MSSADALEAGYRRLLRWYPAWYRGQHQEELLGVLMTAARPGQRRPGARDAADLLWSALRIRVRTAARGAGNEPWTAVLPQFSLLLPLLIVVLMLTEICVRGMENGFGSPADILTGSFGEPGSFARSFQLNPYSVALTSNITGALAGPLPAFAAAALVCCGLRRAAVTVAAIVPLAYLAVALPNNFTLVAGWRTDGVLYAYGLEALVLIAAAGTSRGWQSLRWRPAVLLAVGTAALAAAVNGGLWPLFPQPAQSPGAAYLRLRLQYGVLGQRLGVGLGGWGEWLLATGTLVALIAVVLVVLLVSSPVNRRVLFLLALPFAAAAVFFLCNLVNPPLPDAVGNTVVTVPLLVVLLASLALARGRQRGVAQHPTTPGHTA